MVLTPEQKVTLKTNIESDPVLSLLSPSNPSALQIAKAYNSLASPVFVVWRSDVTKDEIGNAWVGTDIDGMSSLNMQRLQLLFTSIGERSTFDMRRTDRRAGFENPFGVNVNNSSRVAMRAVWKRNATRLEKLLGSGTGSDASPGITTFEGTVTYSEINQVMGWIE